MSNLEICLVSKHLEIFLLSFCFSFLAWEHSLYDFNYFKFRGLFYGSDYSLCWYMFYEFWNRLYILQWVGGVLSMCWLDTVGWWCWWYILVDFLYNCSEMVLKSSTTLQVCLFLLSFSSIDFSSHILWLYCLAHTHL